MEQKKSKWIVIVLVAVVVLGAATYVWKQGWFNAMAPASMQATKVERPEIKSELAQSALITPEEGGVIRAVDPLGVAFVLRVPPQAVTEEVEITVTPFMPKGDGVNYGVSIEPANLVFEKTVTIGVNWYLAGKLGHKNPYSATPFAVRIDGSKADFVPIDKVTVSTNYVPVLVTGGGEYGISDDVNLARKAAEKTFKESDDRFARMYAGLSLSRQGALAKSDATILEADIAAVRTEENPPVREVYVSLLLENGLSKMSGFIPRAHAYGLLDGYLQFRCNLKESTYEDVLTAMIIAANAGYSDVEQVCKARAEELLLERANLIDRDPNRPLIDAVEVLQQMQLLGMDNDGHAGAEVAQRLSDDVVISIEKYLQTLGQDPTDEEMTGRVREHRPSDDKLIKGNSTLMQEMIGVHLLPVIGINAFDESSLKEFGARTRQQMDAFIGIGYASCDLIDALGGGGDASIQKECQKIRSGMFEKGMDQWKTEVDEYAEGVGDIQKGETPNSNWNDLTPLEPFERFLER